MSFRHFDSLYMVFASFYMMMGFSNRFLAFYACSYLLGVFGLFSVESEGFPGSLASRVSSYAKNIHKCCQSIWC